VEAVATRGEAGDVSVLAWSLTLDQSKAAGDPGLDRAVALRVDGLDAGATYTLTHEGVDADHSNVAATWAAIRQEDQAWPTDEQWDTLRKADRLEELAAPVEVTADEHGTVTVEVTLRMPSMHFLRLAPA
jgi:xylan 1,4-beta-xylosidase